MASKDFILQGFTAETHREALQWALGCPDIERALFGVAYLNESGVDLLRADMTQIGNRLTVFAGIRNSVTSHQGLHALLGLGVTTYAVDTGARTIVFHPKVFCAIGRTEARIVIGSANLTTGGLNNNIEAGVKISCDLANEEDAAFTASITSQFDTLPADHPQNVTLLTTERIAEMEKLGLILDESLVTPPSSIGAAGATGADAVPRIKLKVPRRYRPINPERHEPAPIESHRTTSPAWSRVWGSKPLTERDLTIPQGANTHRTGSINLDKGLLPPEVDLRHYFRDEVFDGLTWQPERPTTETTSAVFELVITGVSHGVHTLRLSHTTNTAGRMYAQRNAMTRLQWGAASPLVAQPNLLGRTLSLYRDMNHANRFLVEID